MDSCSWLLLRESKNISKYDYMYSFRDVLNVLDVLNVVSAIDLLVVVFLMFGVVCIHALFWLCLCSCKTLQ